MKRRTFIKGLALALLAPKMLTEVLAEPRSGWTPITADMIDADSPIYLKWDTGRDDAYGFINHPIHGAHCDYIIMDDPFEVTDLSHIKNLKEWIYPEVRSGKE